jgi:hypothetical protein
LWRKKYHLSQKVMNGLENIWRKVAQINCLNKVSSNFFQKRLSYLADDTVRFSRRRQFSRRPKLLINAGSEYVLECYSLCYATVKSLLIQHTPARVDLMWFYFRMGNGKWEGMVLLGQGM